jgi:hypothetical protein
MAMGKSKGLEVLEIIHKFQWFSNITLFNVRKFCIPQQGSRKY